ncbi:TonB-dependent receptor [Stakelama sp. CBK3Z-3]|uniref:TonB-dependent receptor n=1 Tax=Stakelama flava TaxID=2860338 RepID=A0ABS6XNL4_9SPHN|nr:TonB-dependent receptor [Stakelama flava]MBW4331799.1 TonB-dependent receptor [Stakelama flava]
MTDCFRTMLMAGAGVATIMAAPMASAQQREYNVPAGSMRTALEMWSRQSGRELIYRSDDLTDRASPGVRGASSADTALAAILRGSGLEARRHAGGTIAIVPLRTAKARVARASATRPAAAPVAQLQTVTPPDTAAPEAEDIVVTGIRRSLERAAESKRQSKQVVDTIVAEDIGKFPDPTTAAALQRVPGVQVSVDDNNELGNVRVRGLPDILTTVNGREVFTTTGRSFNLQDLPAQALSRVTVYKSQSPDIIEGGLAGLIDLELARPFDFKDRTLSLSVKNNYGTRVDKSSPQIGGLFTDRFDTSIGEIGVLVNGFWSRNEYYRAQTQVVDRRSSAAAPLNTAGYLVPNILRNWQQSGRLERTEFNGSLQWQASDAMQLYVDGLYTRAHDRGSNTGANAQPFTSNVSIADAQASDHCFQTRANANGLNPRVLTDAEGNQSLQPYTVQTLCEVKQATFENPVINLTTQAQDDVTTNKLVAGGARYGGDGLTGNVDISYQTSRNDTTNITADIGKRLDYLTYVSDVDNVAQFTVPDGALLDADDLSLRNAFQQRFLASKGSLFAAKADAEKEIGGILDSIKVGVRYAKRTGHYKAVILNTAFPGGNIGTATEDSAVLVSESGLPAAFLGVSEPAPGLNGGARYFIPDPDYLLSESGLDALRTYVGLPTGRPDYQPGRQFDADEQTLAGYAMVNYNIPLGGALSVDGVIGGRLVRTRRSIRTFAPVDQDASNTEAGDVAYEAVKADTTDTDFLPDVNARIRFGGGLQARFSYSQAIRRPEFVDLNPAVTVSESHNPFVQNVGSAGNPDLKPQKSDSYDATFEYYFGRGYLAVAAYYRDITGRVINGSQIETIDGVDYNVTRPRNIGEAELKGVEVNGQYFLDFLPGDLSGFGVMGAFTYLDSEVKGDDPLAGYPLQGVSKYNYTAGLIYDHGGLSGRLVYTYRSKYFVSDQTGATALRPIADDAVDDVSTPVLLGVTRPAGRLDFNIGYDVTPRFRIDVGGVNILRNETKSYYGSSDYNFDDFLDETTYSVGVRIRL